MGDRTRLRLATLLSDLRREALIDILDSQVSTRSLTTVRVRLRTLRDAVGLRFTGASFDVL